MTDNLGADGDDFYSALMQAHAGLDQTQSQALNARLVLLLANEVGDLQTLNQLLQKALANKQP